MAIVPFDSTIGETQPASGADHRVMGWVVLCYSDERESIQEALAAAGCLCDDLANVCDMREKDVLGSGGFSTVLRARGVNGCDVAVKRISAGGDRSTVLSEVSCFVDVQPHPNIVRFHGLFACSSAMGPSGLAIVIDFAAGGDLCSHCSVAGCLAEGSAASVMHGILSALAHIHAAGVIHRDVKPENVLLMADGRAVLADFGASCRASDSALLQMRFGSLGYAAPELLAGRKYGRPVDCFGAGGILYFALSGSPPFESKTREALMWKTQDCKIDLEKRPWTGIAPACKELLQQLLCRSPKERITAAEGSQHSWLSVRHGCGQEALAKPEALFRKCQFLQNTFKAFCRFLPMGL